jgi:hypothetical protein
MICYEFFTLHKKITLFPQLLDIFANNLSLITYHLSLRDARFGRLYLLPIRYYLFANFPYLCA